ncbi:E3 ubiquitin-protein ligase CIP8-like [Salvia miltiorrhiza]|uniref:E3 ubiquitin-protein ligase CIP8-like n=1 Tax=Salvia miltiorrhiza TaxID=226208 RepID=UPI0025AC2399|nr:E3 ubiquitin-protein ligase CIP8-like [Salvia miltiorrhiza]
MAEVSNLHRQRPSRRPAATTIRSQLEDALHEEEEFYNQPHPFVFDSFSPPHNSSNPSFFDDYATSFDLGFELNSETENLGCEYEDPNCFFVGGEEDDDQMNYVTDLFEPRHAHPAEDIIWQLESRRVEDLGMEFGFGPGLRVVSMDSESDTEEFEVNAGFTNDDDDDYNLFGVRNHRYHAGENDREEFEWEEVSERIRYDGRESMNMMINGIEEISVSDISSSDIENSSLGDDGERPEVGRNVAWEVLLAVDNLDRNLDFEIPEENSIINGDESLSHINLPEDYIMTMEYDALFGQLVENDNASKGSPPAAKSVVKNLPSLVLTKEDVEQNNSVVVCAVCKDEVAIGEKVTRLPCCHLYHGDCILPWLSIRNTCPVCRHELPTDDADYEKRKSERGRLRSGSAGHLFDDLELRYNFELLP